MNLTKIELDSRRERFIKEMNAVFPNWDTAIILSKVNQYYFMGTMQDGMLIIKKGGEYSYHVRRSYERAVEESPLLCIHPMGSYRDAAKIAGSECGNTYMEGDTVPFLMVKRIGKYFSMNSLDSLDNVVRTVRSVKSPYELERIERSGRLHDQILINEVPRLLRKGMSEAELVGEFFNVMMRYGYHGISRFSKFQTEMTAGQFAFGINSLNPTNFDGPGGSAGVGAAAPVAGSHTRRLKKGDLVFVDVAFGVDGYHSDKTQVYFFGAAPSAEVIKIHKRCMEIQSKLAGQLKPGAIPGDIYKGCMSEIEDDFKTHFMGYKNQTVKFLGHGVGLHVDELPVIAAAFNEPLKENMVIALEPKRGIEGIGMVGVEDTYVVTKDGGRCLTGGGRDIIVVD